MKFRKKLMAPQTTNQRRRETKESKRKLLSSNKGTKIERRIRWSTSQRSRSSKGGSSSPSVVVRNKQSSHSASKLILSLLQT